MRFFIFVLFFTLLHANELNLTKKDKEFINSNKFICISTNSWAPFNTSSSNGKLIGISVDFWKTIKKKLNLKTSCIIAKNWKNVLKSLKNKNADISLGTDISDQKKKFAIFSKPYAIFPIAIATRNDVGFIASMIFLKNKTIAVGKGYTAAHLLKKYYPNLKIIEVENTKEALKLVSENKAYAAIDIMPVLVYNINKYEFANLKIAGKTPWEFKLRFILSKKEKNYQLLKLINRAIDTISQNKKESIYKKWIHVSIQKGFSLKEVFAIVATAGVIILILLFWVFYLHKEIKKRKKIENRLKVISSLDPLTGISNRFKINQTLLEQIEYSKRHDTPLSIIFFDIDHFKKINDTYGHIVGDKILKDLTKLIKNNLRKYDVFGRWGGEEFIIILPNTDINQAIEVAAKLKEKIKKHHFPKVKRLTCSFGVTSLREDDDLTSLLNRADILMYEAKKRGRDRIIADSYLEIT